MLGVEPPVTQTAGHLGRTGVRMPRQVPPQMRPPPPLPATCPPFPPTTRRQHHPSSRILSPVLTTVKTQPFAWRSRLSPQAWHISLLGFQQTDRERTTQIPGCPDWWSSWAHITSPRARALLLCPKTSSLSPLPFAPDKKPVAHTESTRQYRPNLGCGNSFLTSGLSHPPRITLHEGDNCKSQACEKSKEDRRLEPSLSETLSRDNQHR